MTCWRTPSAREFVPSNDDPAPFVLKELTALLEGITPANGYQHVDRHYRVAFVVLSETLVLHHILGRRTPTATNVTTCSPNSGCCWCRVGPMMTRITQPTPPLMADVKKRLAEMAKDTYPTTNPLYMRSAVKDRWPPMSPERSGHGRELGTGVLLPALGSHHHEQFGRPLLRFIWKSTPGSHPN